MVWVEEEQMVWVEEEQMAWVEEEQMVWVEEEQMAWVEGASFSSSCTLTILDSLVPTKDPSTSNNGHLDGDMGSVNI